MLSNRNSLNLHWLFYWEHSNFVRKYALSHRQERQYSGQLSPSHTVTFSCELKQYLIHWRLFVDCTYSPQFETFMHPVNIYSVDVWQRKQSITHWPCHWSSGFFFPKETFILSSTVFCWMRAWWEITRQPKPTAAISEPHLFTRGRWCCLHRWCHPQTSTEGWKVTFHSGLSVTYIMRGLYVSHNWSHMSLLSLQQEAQSRAQPCHHLAKPPTASRTAPEVHSVCWQGDASTVMYTWHHLSKLRYTLNLTI